jgi:TonB family protein
LKLFDTDVTDLKTEPAEDTSYAAAGAFRPDLPRDVGELHLLVEELEDDRASGRMREAFWISVIAHLVLFLFLLLSPKMFPNGFGKRVVLVQNQAANQSPTFLELPPDAQKYMQRPKTNILSDKDRIAQSKNPVPFQPPPEELERMRRQGAPGSRPQPRPQAPAQPQTPPQQAPPQMAQATPPPQQTPQESQLQQPQSQPRQQAQAQRPNPFAMPQTAGSAIENAVRAAASDRGNGSGGDYGIGVQPHAGVKSGVEVLSDTQGVDFGPYLARVVESVRRNWYAIMPEEVNPPISKTGRVVIDFSIIRNGSTGPVIVRLPSGDIALDRAAQGGITGANPFPPLPGAFHGDHIDLRFSFFYLGPNGKLQ